MDLQGRVALITGAGTGIGAAAAMALAQAGADVVLASRTASEIEDVASAIERLGRRALAVAADVADEVDARRLFASIKRKFKWLDVVVANAGINGVWAPIDELKPREWDETIRVNLRGTYLTLHHAVPLMGKGGSIVITASINGTRTFTSAGASAYSTTKAGQLAFGQMLALELAPRGIRVNVVCPGAITTEIDDNTKKRSTARAKIPAKYPRGTALRLKRPCPRGSGRTRKGNGHHRVAGGSGVMAIAADHEEELQTGRRSLSARGGWASLALEEGTARTVPLSHVLAVKQLCHPATASDGAHDCDQQASTHDCHDELAENAAHGCTEHHRQQEVSEEGTHDAENDVHEQAHVRVHCLLRDPPGETADQDRKDPTNTFHSSSP